MLTVAEETLQRARRGARQAGRDPPLRPGDQRRDLRHLQGRPAAQGRGRGGGQHRRRPGVLDARRTTPSRRASSTSCSPIRPTARAGRATWSAWAARTASRTRASSSSTTATRNTRSSPAPATARCCSWPTCSRKMKHDTPLGSRIAEVHNGSSLFTGDAGQGESNIRRWIIENDWLEAIVALPLNMFYNTGIATYIWVLTQPQARAPQGQGAAHRRHAVVQAAAQEPRQEELRAVRRGHRAHLRHVPRLRGDRAVEDLPQRGLRLLEGDGRAAAARSTGIDPERAYSPKEIKALQGRAASADEDGAAGHPEDHKGQGAPTRCAACSRRRSAARRAWSSTSPTPSCATPSRCRCSRRAASRRSSAARCCRTRRTPGIDAASIKIGYEISFTRYFYKPQPLRTLEEIRADILALEKETEGLLGEIIGGDVR